MEGVSRMDIFAAYLADIENTDNRHRLEEILRWVNKEFPNLEPIFKWNTPMFSNHGTFIIGFSTAKHHLSVAPEAVTMEYFSEEISQAGYRSTKGLFRIPWNKDVNYDLLKRIIEFNIRDKAEYTHFWRK